jgi:hypothetical protein
MESIGPLLQRFPKRFNRLDKRNRRIKQMVATMLIVPILLLATVLTAPVARGQKNGSPQIRGPSKEELSKLQASMPSKEELSELLAKADEKVSTFEQAVGNAKPQLDKINTEYARNYLDAASTAHTLIQATNQKGTSAYRLVGILATMDDLSLDAASGSVFLMGADNQQLIHGKPPDMDTQNPIIALTAAGTTCNDISELIFHATMRLVNVEEKLVDLLLD